MTFGCYKEAVISESEKGSNYCTHHAIMKNPCIPLKMKTPPNLDPSATDVVTAKDLKWEDSTTAAKNENLNLLEKNPCAMCIKKTEKGPLIKALVFTIGKHRVEGLVFSPAGDMSHAHPDKHCDYCHGVACLPDHGEIREDALD